MDKMNKKIGQTHVGIKFVFEDGVGRKLPIIKETKNLYTYISSKGEEITRNKSDNYIKGEKYEPFYREKPGVQLMTEEEFQKKIYDQKIEKEKKIGEISSVLDEIKSYSLSPGLSLADVRGIYNRLDKIKEEFGI